MPNLSPSFPSSDARLALDQETFGKLLRRTTGSLVIFLGLPVLALLGLVFFLLRSAAWVDHSHEVISRATNVGKLLVTMQTSFRGFRLSSQESLLEPYITSSEQMDRRLNELSQLVLDSPGQTRAVQEMRANKKAWEEFVDQEIARVRSGATQARDPGFLVEGTRLFGRAAKSVDDFLLEEDRLRGVRDRRLDRVITALLVLLAVVVCIGIPALTLWVRRLLALMSGSYQANLGQAERRASELRITLKSIGDAVISTDAEGRIDFLNSAAEDLLGWSSTEARGLPLIKIFDIFNEQTRELAENPVERVLRENIVVALANHTVLRTKSGSEVPIEDSAAPIRNEKGEILGVILVFRDVSGKRHAEKILQSSEQRLRFINDLSEEIRRLIGPEEIMAASARLLGRHLQAARCVYGDVQDGQWVVAGDFSPDLPSFAGSHDLEWLGSSAAASLREGKTLILHDSAASAPAEVRARLADRQVQALACAPVVKDDHLQALLMLQQQTPRVWKPEEIELLGEVAERCWAAVEKSRSDLAALERSRLSTMRADIAGQLDLGEPLDRTLQGCCELLVRHLDAAFARIWTLNNGDEVLHLRASAGLYTHLDGPHARVPVGQFKIGRIAQSHQAHLTNDVQNDPNVSNQEWARKEGMVAFAGFPLLVENRILGVLALFARQPLSPISLHDLQPISEAVAQHLERKNSEAALHSSEMLKSAILNTALDGFILMDHEGRIRDWNAAAEQIFGFSHEAAVGRLLGDMIVPEPMREAHRQGLDRYLHTREARILGRRYELPGLRAGNQEFPCEISITHIPQTEPPLYAGYVRDITERKKAETSLRTATAQAEASARAVTESAERFRLLSSVVVLQVWTALPSGELDYANQECRTFFGEGVTLQDAWTRLVHPDDLAPALAGWQAALTGGQRFESEFRLLHRDGEYRWFLVRAQALHDAENRIVKWFGTNTDIHALKVAQADAERASQAKDSFLAALSHELRTPLTPVLMTASALREDERLPTDVREQLGMMERNIALEARLIDDLLDLTRIARGKFHLRAEPCDAHSLIGLAVEIVRDDALAKGISLQREFTARKSGLLADPARFQQVIWNLLRNAVKFTPSGGKISIRTRDTSEDGNSQTLRIEVADSGIGIEQAVLDRIFLPFEQGGLTGDHRFGGMGLGLAIARAIVDLHGGNIRAESLGANRGATFIVELPGATEPPHGVADGDALSPFLLADNQPQRLPEKKNGPSLRLLLVEDHEATLLVLSRLLSRSGHQVVTANSVANALAAAAAGTFDLVISDLGLPDGTGIQLMEQLRDTHHLRGIALSGYGMEEDIARSRKAGFFTHLIKPVDFTQLRRTLATFQADLPQIAPRL